MFTEYFFLRVIKQLSAFHRRRLCLRMEVWSWNV